MQGKCACSTSSEIENGHKPNCYTLISRLSWIASLYFLIDDTSGFQFAYKDGGSLGECNTTETIVLFQCNENAEWDAYNADVSRFVDGFLPDIENECLVKIFLSLTSYFLFFFLIVPDDIGLQWSLYYSEANLSTSL